MKAGQLQRRRGVKSPDCAESVMLAFVADQSDPVESKRAFAQRIGEWQRQVAKAEAQGRPPPPSPYDGKALVDLYHRSAAEYRKLAGI